MLYLLSRVGRTKRHVKFEIGRERERDFERKSRMCIRELPFLCSPTDRALERVDVHSFQIGSTGYFLLFQKVDRRTLGKRRSGGGGGAGRARGQEMFKIRDDLFQHLLKKSIRKYKVHLHLFSISLPFAFLLLCIFVRSIVIAPKPDSSSSSETL